MHAAPCLTRQRSVLFSALLLALSACSPTPPPAAADSTPPPPEVAVVTVARGTVGLLTELPGRTEAYRTAQVRARVAGIVQRQLFREGSEVQANQALFQIDDAPYPASLASAQASLARAEANLMQAQAQAQRDQPLVEAHAISQQDYVSAVAQQKLAQADVAAAKAALQSAQINLAYAALPQETNVGSARLKGIELEMEARFGNFSANAAASYLDYTTLDCGLACVSAGQGGTVPSNGVAPLTPKRKFSVGMQYAIASGQAGTFTPRIDYTYQSTVYFDISNFEMASQDAYGLLNARLMWSDMNSKWSSQLAITNLSNKVYYLNMYNLYNGGLGSITGQPAAPREVFLSVKRKF